MLHHIIEASVRHRFVVLIFALLAGLGGVYAMLRTPVDAIPDLSDVQVIIHTEFAGQAPQVVEDLVTYPLTTAMLSVPYAKTVRGYSFFGVSFVYIIFEDGTDLYWARSRVLEYLNVVASRLPQGVTPTLGPDATGVGWIYEYVLEGGNRYDLQQLRSIQDWFLRYELMSVEGVAEVASLGGFVKQYQVEVDPNRLQAYGVSLRAVRSALERSNSDVGGRLIEIGESEFMVRGLGYIRSVEDIEQTAVGVDDRGIPILVRHVARVQVGPELRRGVADFNGEGEVVGGIIVMRHGANTLETIEAVKERLAALEDGLPPGVTIRAAYDRSGLILSAIDHLKRKLLEECLMVAVVVMLFLLSVRCTLVVLLSLPLGILLAFLAMHFQGLNANIMSLSGIGIAIGAMVDGAIVMVENAHRHLALSSRQKDHWSVVAGAAKEVGPPLFYSLLIITLSFLPVFALQAQEGRLFGPLAYTKTYAMAAAALLAVTLVPVLVGYFVRGSLTPAARNPIHRLLAFIYGPLIRVALRRRWLVLAGAVLVLASTAYPLSRLGSEFMPPLDEGDLLYMPTTDPGISITKAKELLQQTDRIIASFPEVEHVLGKAGRAETATDPAPLSMIESTIRLKPRSQWPEGMTHERLVEELDQAIAFPGLTNAWTMPIKARTDMLSTGIKTPVGVKIMGPDPEVLAALGQEVVAALSGVPGTASAFADKTLGGNFLDFTINREEAARYGLAVADVQEVIMSAAGGSNVTRTVEGLERYPVSVRYSRDLRSTPEAIGRMLIDTPHGARIPLSYVAAFDYVAGPPVIRSENARRTAWVYVDIRDTDVGTYVSLAQRAVAAAVDLPDGYSLMWSGQFEYMQRAEARLRIVVPVTLLIILLLLYLNFGRLAECLMVMLSLPFALAGGIWLLHLLDYALSVAVGVGLLALAGLAAELGVLMLTYLHRACESREAEGRMSSMQDLREAVIAGTTWRLRPVLMTVITVVAGLLPLMWGHGTGSQVMQRVAAPMVGGMISATVLCLFVIPVVFYLWRGRTFGRTSASQEASV